MHFRPCIDLHDGKVKQIVGASLDSREEALKTNFVAEESPAYFAEMYRRDGLRGGHVIMLGPGNEAAAGEALKAAPGILQVGGGITAENALSWLQLGAAKVIVTSYLFPEHEFSPERLRELGRILKPEQLVLDLSCRRTPDGKYFVACNRWQTLTSLEVNGENLACLAGFCGEFLIHGVDVEGRQAGIDQELVRLLAENSPVAVTYAGGVRSREDIRRIRELGRNRIDFTVGSALDIFGGKYLAYDQLVQWEREQFASLPETGMAD